MLKRIMPVLLLGVALLFSVIAVRAAVDLTYFDGVWTSNGSRLFWGTASEDDSQGFYLWRSTQDLQVVNGALNTSQATRVSAFIPGQVGVVIQMVTITSTSTPLPTRPSRSTTTSWRV